MRISAHLQNPQYEQKNPLCQHLCQLCNRICQIGTSYHNCISKKLARTCGILFKVRHLLPTNTLVSVYNALFLSFRQYGITVWGQTYTTYTEPIFKMQKSVVREISHQSYLAHSLPIFRELKLLRLSDIFKLKLLTFVFEASKMITPVCFHNFFLIKFIHASF